MQPIRAPFQKRQQAKRIARALRDLKASRAGGLGGLGADAKRGAALRGTGEGNRIGRGEDESRRRLKAGAVEIHRLDAQDRGDQCLDSGQFGGEGARLRLGPGQKA